jgi:hypothetical protein
MGLTPSRVQRLCRTRNPTIPPISSVLAMVESLLFHLDNTLFRFGWRYDIAVVEANQCLKFTGAA